MNLEKLTKGAIKIAEEVGQFIRTEASNFDRKDAEIKGTNDMVSYVDKTSEEMLVDKLTKLLPGSGILAEEGTEIDADIRWVIDPLDGTTNFIHGVPTYAISIGLLQENEITSGLVYEINHNEMFYAWKDNGAFLNKKPISVSSTKTLADSLISTGFPVQNFSMIDPYLKLVEKLIRNSHGLRRVGSAATDLAYVACGRYDAFFEYNLNPWDVAAGIILIQEAGGQVSDFKGQNDYLFGRQILGAGGLYPEILSLIDEMWFSEDN
jgi:myo-inositol-1(or 4)-monophosphatase